MEGLDALRALVAARRDIPEPKDRRSLREAAGVSLVALAVAVGVEPDAMARLERMKVVPEGHAVAYAAALKALTPVKPLTEEELANYKILFQHPCPACGGVHPEGIADENGEASPAACPRVRRVVYDSQKRVTELEFWPEDRWSRDGIVFPSMLKSAES